MIRPDKVNDILDEAGVAVNVKSGMLRNVTITFDKLKILHEFTTRKLFRKKLQADESSLKIDIEEVLFTLGTSFTNLSKNDEFEDYSAKVDEHGFADDAY